jgi:DNA-binding response OmpR family regulator
LDPGINFLQKPFSIQEIATKVSEVIRQSEAAEMKEGDI